MRKPIFYMTALIAIMALIVSFIDRPPGSRAALGQMLFFDPILSKDSTISCASCHKPKHAFADTTPVSIGHAGARGTRNTPTAMNLLLRRDFFWDGRATSMEEQALAPIENPVEMNLPLEEAIRRLQRSSQYRPLFQKLFYSDPTRENLALALTAFERTLETSDSPFDEWKFTDNPAAVSEAVKRGFAIFNTKGKCVQCHFGADLTANEFRNVGLFNGKNLDDSGRMLVTGRLEDLGKFKTPSLRNVAVTAPYMHNGMLATLEEVIEFYDDPVKMVGESINRDTVLLKPLGLSRREKLDLEAFLLSLTDKRFSETNKKSNE